MTDTPLGEQDITEDDAPSPAGRSSVWERLRAEHQKLAAERPPLELEVPGSDWLVVRYRYVPLKETAKTAERLRKVRDISDQALLAAVDTLILACEEILVRLPDGLSPLAGEGEEPIRFDERLARGMEWEPGPTGYSARSICRRLFMNDYAIMEQAAQVSEWMSDTGKEIGDEFLGG